METKLMLFVIVFSCLEKIVRSADVRCCMSWCSEKQENQECNAEQEMPNELFQTMGYHEAIDFAEREYFEIEKFINTLDLPFFELLSWGQNEYIVASNGALYFWGLGGFDGYSAMGYCESFGSRLVSAGWRNVTVRSEILNGIKKDSRVQIAHQANRYLVGLNKLYGKGEWVFIDGEPAVFQHMFINGGEISGEIGEDCAAFINTPYGLLFDDIKCYENSLLDSIAICEMF